MKDTYLYLFHRLDEKMPIIFVLFLVFFVSIIVGRTAGKRVLLCSDATSKEPDPLLPSRRRIFTATALLPHTKLIEHPRQLGRLVCTASLAASQTNCRLIVTSGSSPAVKINWCLFLNMKRSCSCSS